MEASMYGDWAEYYDEVYVDQANTGDLAFYLAEAKAAGGPVLEAGCGTGRILLPTLAEGVDIDGFDLTETMLARLRERAAAAGLSPHIWRADMRTFTAPRKYALVTCPFRAFLHLLTVEDQLAGLTRFREALLPGGRLLLNVFHPSYSITVAQQGQWTLDDEFVHRATNRHTRLWVAVTNDLINQVKTVRERFDELDEGGRVVAQREIEMKLAWIFTPQMELLLRCAGYSRWAFYGGFDRRPLANDNDEMVVEAWA
jgi:SAM-dependent methyltransferase